MESSLSTVSMWVWAGAVMFFAGGIQGASGFAFGLLVVPLLLSLGLPVDQAVAMCVTSSVVQRAYAVFKLHGAADWKTLRPMIVTGLVAIPMGIFGLRGLTFLSEGAVKQVIGVCVLVLLLVQWFSKVEPKDAVHKAWGHLAAFFAGLLTGFANIGGPPIVLWILAHRWDNEKTRVTQMAFSICLAPLQMTIMAFTFGRPAIRAGGDALLLTPLVLLGTWVGLKLGGLLKKDHLRLIVRLLLLAIALSCILRPMF